MDATERAELRRVAEAATPGRWEMVPTVGNAVAAPDESGYWTDVADRVETEEDSEHIATFDPPTVLALLSEVEFAGKACDGYRIERDEAEDERDVARAAIARVRELHREVPGYLPADECECADQESHEVTARAVPGRRLPVLVCLDSPTGESTCEGCPHEPDDDPMPWPCPTRRVLDGDTGKVAHHDPA